MSEDVPRTTRTKLDECPWLVQRGRAYQFEEIVEDAMGIPDQELVVFTGGKTFWPLQMEQHIDKLQAEPPDWPACANCGVLTDSNYHGRLLDETVICSQGCLRDWLDEETDVESDGRINNEGTKLY